MLNVECSFRLVTKYASGVLNVIILLRAACNLSTVAVESTKSPDEPLLRIISKYSLRLTMNCCILPT